MNLITSFANIEDLFNHLEDIFDNLYQKKHAIEKFRELKIEASLFSNFYSKFIQLISYLKYISEIFIREFDHKLTPRLQDCLNSRVELSTSISSLAKRYLSIFKQMQALNRIKNKTKPLQLIQTLAPTY